MFYKTRRLSSFLFVLALTPGVFMACDCGGDDPEPGKAAKINSFIVTPMSVKAGETVDISWNVSDATSVSVVANTMTIVDKDTNLVGSKNDVVVNDETVFVL